MRKVGCGQYRFQIGLVARFVRSAGAGSELHHRCIVFILNNGKFRTFFFKFFFNDFERGIYKRYLRFRCLYLFVKQVLFCHEFLLVVSEFGKSVLDVFYLIARRFEVLFCLFEFFLIACRNGGFGNRKRKTENYADAENNRKCKTYRLFHCNASFLQGVE